MTLSGYFALNPVFAPVGIEVFCLAFENNRVKTNTEIPILSAVSI